MATPQRASNHEYVPVEESPNRSSLTVDDEEREALCGPEGKEFEYPSPRPRPSRLGRLGNIITFRGIFEVLLLALVVLLLVDKYWYLISGNRHAYKYEGAGDITGFAPRFDQEITTFAPDERFMPSNASEFFSDSTRQAWLSIVPRGLGYLHVKEPEKYTSLPTPLEYYDDDFVVTTSMTHQLHCLYHMAEVYSAFISNRTDKIPTETPWHLTHCFDYIRQGIMCCGDVAVEGRETTFPEDWTGSDGWDAKHVCKNYDQVLDYLDRNAERDETWI